MVTSTKRSPPPDGSRPPNPTCKTSHLNCRMSSLRGSNIEKQCTYCKQVKPLSDFYKVAGTQRSRDGYRNQCKPCHQEYQNTAANRAETAARYYRKRKESDPALFMWKQAKHRAKYDYNNMEFSIEVADIQIPETCPYLGVAFVPLDKDLGYSLDRIDSAKGYTKDNIRVISYMANKMKNNATEGQLVAFAKGVLSLHQGGQGPC